MLFPKIGDSLTEFTGAIWTQKGIAIVGTQAYSELKSSLAYYKDKDAYGPGAFLICAFRCPTAKFTSVTYSKLFEDVLIEGRSVRKQLYMLNNSQMWEIYRGWRRCYCQGYAATDSFNLYGPGYHNPMTQPENHFSFDIRLGYLLVMDRRITRLVGEGPEQFKLKVSKSLE